MAHLKRPVVGPDDAEEFAAEVLRAVGFHDARRTATGPDAGLDVVAQDIVAQVKHQLSPVGRPDLQRLVGSSKGKRTAFFASGGYSPPAVEYANGEELALVVYSVMGDVAPANPWGEVLLDLEVGGKQPSVDQQAFIERHARVHQRGEAIIDEINRLNGRIYPNKQEKKALQKIEPLYRSMIQGFEDLERMTYRIPDDDAGAERVLGEVAKLLDRIETTQDRIEQLLDIRY